MRIFPLIKKAVFTSVAISTIHHSEAFSQILERNLADLTQNKSQIIKSVSSAAKDIRNSIDEILLNKKAASLMFDDEQNINIERAIDSLRNSGITSETENDLENEDGSSADRQYSRNEKSYIYLGSIIYLTPKDWVVWINNQKITSVTNSRNNELYLRSVDRDKVKLLWTMSLTKWKILSNKNSEESAPKINDKNQVEIQFELKPNQTFILTNGKINEGRVNIQKPAPDKDSKTSKPSIFKEKTPQSQSATAKTEDGNIVKEKDATDATTTNSNNQNLLPVTTIINNF